MKLKISEFIFFVSVLSNIESTTMTVFVHGTFAIKETMNFSTFFKLWNDNISNSEYEYRVKKLRKESYFFNLQPIDSMGLKKIEYGNTYKGPEIFADIYNKLHKKYHKDDDCLYYTYGWSGLLSACSRLEESFIFYEELKKEIENLEKKYGKKPKVRLIGHSHGGNLCLNLAFAKKERPKDSFKINELILLGMPVQRCTSDLIQDEFFENIYHIFSTGDYVQRLDIFSPYNLLSKKHFKEKENCKLPDKLIQIELMLTIQSKSKPTKTLNKSPGHVELWFFGWTPRMYRKKHPFYPLPTGIFTPYFTHICKKHMPNEKYIKFLIKPEVEKIQLKGKTNNIRKTVSFIPKKQLDFLKDHALKKYETRKILKMPTF